MTREEAINEIKSWDFLEGKEIEAIHTLIPELKESEDERIIKTLQEYVKNRNWPLNGPTQDEAFAWLEKQKYDRMKPIYDARESFESALEKAWDDYHDGYENVDKLEDDYVECAHAKGFREGYLFGIEKQKGQIPHTDFVVKPHKGDDANPYDMSASEAQEYTMNRGFDVPWNDGDVFVDARHMTQTIGNVLRWADEHPKEQRPTVKADDDMSFILDLLEEQLRRCKKNREGARRSRRIHSAMDWVKSAHTEKAVDEGDGKAVEQWPKMSNCKHDCRTCLARCIYRKERNPEQQPK